MGVGGGAGLAKRERTARGPGRGPGAQRGHRVRRATAFQTAARAPNAKAQERDVWRGSGGGGGGASGGHGGRVPESGSLRLSDTKAALGRRHLHMPVPCACRCEVGTPADSTRFPAGPLREVRREGEWGPLRGAMPCQSMRSSGSTWSCCLDDSPPVSPLPGQVHCRSFLPSKGASVPRASGRPSLRVKGMASCPREALPSFLTNSTDDGEGLQTKLTSLKTGSPAKETKVVFRVHRGRRSCVYLGFPPKASAELWAEGVAFLATLSHQIQSKQEWTLVGCVSCVPLRAVGDTSLAGHT